MPNTAAKGLPYPLGTDRVMDGDDSIRRLAQSVDNMVQTGTATVNVTTGGTSAPLAVTFPVPFASAPIVVCNAQGAASTSQTASPSGASATGFTANAVRATAGNVTVLWIAVGPVSAVALADLEADQAEAAEVGP